MRWVRLHFSTVHIGTNNRATSLTPTEKSWAQTFFQFPTLWYWSDRGCDGGEHYLATLLLKHTHTHTQSKHADTRKERKQWRGESKQKIAWEKKSSELREATIGQGRNMGYQEDERNQIWQVKVQREQDDWIKRRRNKGTGGETATEDLVKYLRSEWEEEVGQDPPERTHHCVCI